MGAPELLAEAARVWAQAQVVYQAPGKGGQSPALALVQQLAAHSECHDGLIALLASPNQLVAAYALLALEAMSSPVLADLPQDLLARREKVTFHAGSFRWSMDLGGFARQTRKRARERLARHTGDHRMPRLFIALDLPPATAHELTTLQPAPATGLRLVPPDQMHITLHFLGDADTDRIAAALATVTAAPFPLDLRGVGHFQSASGAVTLWAGIEPSAELLRLHAAVGVALAGVGFVPESRPYRPHVSLARCEAEAITPGLVEGFLAQYAGFRIAGVSVTRFGLHSSEQGREAPVYRCERSFPLLRRLPNSRP